MMLSIEISHTQWAIPLEKVHYIDYVENLTPLPFTTSPIEGLTKFNNQPIIQVNLAQALGLEDQSGSKRIIVTTSGGEVALRVDKVLDFVRADLPEKSFLLLQLTETLAWVKTTNPVKAKPAITTPINHPVNYLTALLVVAGKKIVALSSHIIERIEAIDTFQSLEYKDIQPDLLIKVKDELLPAYSLTRFLNHDEEGPKQKAIIVRGTHGHWVLVVEQVLELENIYQIYTTGTDTHELWYLTATGEIRKIINANQLIGEISDSNSIPITQPQWTQSFIHMVEQLSTDGLRITCGNNNYVLPMTIVHFTLYEQLNYSLMTRQRFLTSGCSKHKKTRLPWINGTTLFSGKQGTVAPKYTILITLVQQGQILLGVDRVLLQPTLTKGAWITLTNLPFPTSLFFDAATYEEQTGQWVLQITDNINFTKLSWSIKKAVVKAIEGWFDLEVITESK